MTNTNTTYTTRDLDLLEAVDYPGWRQPTRLDTHVLQQYLVRTEEKSPITMPWGETITPKMSITLADMAWDWWSLYVKHDLAMRALDRDETNYVDGIRPCDTPSEHGKIFGAQLNDKGQAIYDNEILPLRAKRNAAEVAYKEAVEAILAQDTRETPVCP
jgi:hypothetical protein